MSYIVMNIVLLFTLYLIIKYQKDKLIKQIDNCNEDINNLTKFVDGKFNSHKNVLDYINCELKKVDYDKLGYYQKLLEEKQQECIDNLNELLFGNPPLKNKIIIVRNIKEYDYTAYKKDMEIVSQYLDEGWTIVNVNKNEFTNEYTLGYPLQYKGGKQDGQTKKV